jgi:hypothetical protein
LYPFILLRRCATALTGLLILMAVAGQPAFTQMAEVPLTPETVENFIASYPEVRAAGEELKAQYDVPEGDDMSAWQTWRAVGAANSELSAVTQRYGFADFNAWLQTFSTIARAYAFAREGGEIDSQMAEAIEKVRNDPNIPAAQKELILQQLQHSNAAIAGMRPSEESLNAVEPYGEQLKALFDKDS